jgi:hypothetical protein
VFQGDWRERRQSIRSRKNYRTQGEEEDGFKGERLKTVKVSQQSTLTNLLQLE